MRITFGVILLCLLAAPAWAQEPSESRGRKLAISEKLIAVALQQSTATSKPGFDEWNGRLERAKVKRAKGSRLMIIGAGLGVAGPLIGTVMISESGTSVATFALITTVAGSGTFGYGAWTWHSAKGEIDDLDREGRIKGYLTLAPIPGGAQMAAIFTF